MERGTDEREKEGVRRVSPWLWLVDYMRLVLSVSFIVDGILGMEGRTSALKRCFGFGVVTLRLLRCGSGIGVRDSGVAHRG